VLITGRVLEHWHTGSMTRRAGVLDAIEPVPTVSVHPPTWRRWASRPARDRSLETRRGEHGRHRPPGSGMPRGSVFMPFAYVEAAANMLTNPKLDPFGKIPEFKYCAVRSSTPAGRRAGGIDVRRGLGGGAPRSQAGK
jgi:formate dehydrogenase major subunit